MLVKIENAIILLIQKAFSHLETNRQQINKLKTHVSEVTFKEHRSTPLCLSQSSTQAQSLTKALRLLGVFLVYRKLSWVVMMWKQNKAIKYSKLVKEAGSALET